MKSCTESVRKVRETASRLPAARSRLTDALTCGDTAFATPASGGDNLTEAPALARYGGLENRCGVIPTVGSNPTPSAVMRRGSCRTVTHETRVGDRAAPFSQEN
jgi:hypothetical protein